jgi:hypothetical protein
VRRSLYLLALVGLAVAPVASARVGAGSPTSFQFRYRVVAATHTSSSERNEPGIYVGKSTASWRLAPATKRAPNVVSGMVTPSFVTGVGVVNIRGLYTFDAMKNGEHCSVSAPTGASAFPAGAVAPAAFQVAVVLDPKRRIAVALDGNARIASVNNSVIGCAAGGGPTVEPHLFHVTRRQLRQATLTLRSTGSSSRDGVSLTWSTTITLKKVAKKR